MTRRTPARTRIPRALLTALAVAAVALVPTACGGGDDGETPAADSGRDGADNDAGGPCAQAVVDGQSFTLTSADGSATVSGTAPDRYRPTAVAEPCEVAIVDLLATLGDAGELATLGFAVDLGPLLRDSVDDLATDAAGLLVGDDDELITDAEVTVGGRPARRLEVGLAGAPESPGGTGLLVFVDLGDHVATLTAIAVDDDYALAVDDIEAVLASLTFRVG